MARRKLFFPKILGGVALLSSVISMAGFGLLGSPAQSKPEYLSAFNDRYKTSGSHLDSCYTCHASSSPAAENLNPYGKDFSAGYDFGAIEGKDSDGDGFSNIDEIKAGTFPGDPNENPNKKPEPPKKPAPTTTTTKPFPFSLLPDKLPVP